MSIYINKNNQQSGPYEDHVVIEQLRNGMLSPNDMGIRHGGTSWQKLGEMFPGVAAAPSPPPVAGAARAVASHAPANLAAQPAKAAGGCRKPLGWTLFGIGLLSMLIGAAAAVGTQFTYSTLSCDLADSDYKKIEDLKKKYDAAKGTDEEISVEYELEIAMAGYETSAKYCAEQNSTKKMFIIGSIAVALVGFLMAIVGFFVRRV